ncbi:MAG: transcription antitermination factor NusB [Pseudomonadota bacterium]
MSGVASRHAAADLLIKTLEDRRTLDEAMARSEVFDALTGADRAFARAMASASLRHIGRIDLALEPFLDRPLEEATPVVRALLRVGAAQAWLLETPEHAVVGETVEAAKRWPEAQRAVGFLNAVLRKVVATRDGFDATPILNIWPDWLQQELVDGVGEDAAAALAEAQLEQPEIHLTPKSGDAAALAENVSGRIVGERSVHVESTAIEKLPGFDEGEWWVQDTAATLPALLLGVGPDDRVLDLCAAPGGKTMQLAATGAEVIAVDRSKPRLKRLKANLKRTGLQDVKLVAGDATSYRPDSPVSHILLDAPCSALGTLRRHPEGAWIKRREDVFRFPEIQLRLLKAALDMLPIGGTLVYCVCSPLPREGGDVVEAVVDDEAIARAPIRASDCPAFSHCITEKGDLLTLPALNQHDSFNHDAFYISRLTRQA